MQTVQRHRFGSPKEHSGAASVPNVIRYRSARGARHPRSQDPCPWRLSESPFSYFSGRSAASKLSADIRGLMPHFSTGVYIQE
jgi:hypothetical protein